VPKFRAPISPGWKLLFILKDAEGGYVPLDERIFARLYSVSAAKWGNGRKHFEHIENVMNAEKEKAIADRRESVGYSAKEYWDFMAIKSIGKGSKFATHWSG